MKTYRPHYERTPAMKLLLILSFAFACNGKSQHSAATTDTSDTNDTEDTTDTIDTTDTEVVPTSEMTGELNFHDGTPFDGSSLVRVQMCRGDCYMGILDGNKFTFPSLPDGTYAFDVVPLLGDGPREYATAIDFIDIDTSMETLALEASVTVYKFETMSDPLTNGAATLDGDLTVDVDPSGFTPREYYEDDQFLSSVRVNPVEAGLPLSTFPAKEDIVGMWQLGAFESEVAPAWGFQVANSGLEEGQQLRVYNASYKDVEWVEVGTATVDGNGTIVSDPGTGLQILSALVITF